LLNLDGQGCVSIYMCVWVRALEYLIFFMFIYVYIINCCIKFYIFFQLVICFPVDTMIALASAGNEPNQFENSSKLDSVIDSLNLVHETNESNLSQILSSTNKWVELELCIVRFVWFMSQLDIHILHQLH